MKRDNVKKLNEITRKLNDQSLSISRVSANTKRDFIGLANAEFCGDYGSTLKFCYDQSLEYSYMKALFFDKMQNMEDKLDKLIGKFNEDNSLENKQDNEENKPKKRLG